MKLGVGPFTRRRLPGSDHSFSRMYAELIELAEIVETAGLDSVWVSEHHFVDDGYLSGSMPALGAIAALTNEIEIGTCVALAPFHHPVTLAENAATVDLLSSGRLTLGLGLGYRDEEFQGFERAKSDRVELLESQIKFLRRAWSDGPVGYRSRFFDVSPDVSVTPKPDNPPRIVLAGKAKPAVRRAARLGDGWIATTSTSLSGLCTRQADIQSVRPADAGSFDIYVGAQGFVAEDSETAWETMKEGYCYTRRRNLEFHTGEAIPELSETQRQELKAQAVFGSPEEVTEQLARYRTALGDDIHFIFRVFHPGITRVDLERCLTLLGEEVAPALRG